MEKQARDIMKMLMNEKIIGKRVVGEALTKENALKYMKENYKNHYDIALKIYS